jgi:hypothetical protein
MWDNRKIVILDEIIEPCPSLPTAAMTFPIGFGTCWNPICPAVQGPGVAKRAITACSSMRSSGFCVPVPRGATCRPTMVIGKTPIAGFAVGETTASGKLCWNNW